MGLARFVLVRLEAARAGRGREGGAHRGVRAQVRAEHTALKIKRHSPPDLWYVEARTHDVYDTREKEEHVSSNWLQRSLHMFSLTSGAEVPVAEPPVAGEPHAVSTRQAVLEALSLHGPMRAKDIVEAVVTRPDVELRGKTPRKSVEARLAEGVRRGELAKTGRGVYKVSPAGRRKAAAA